MLLFIDQGKTVNILVWIGQIIELEDVQNLDK